ncbi:MAG: hydantoinase/oxoprolinase family protein [Desulfobacteraceae bacterium]
MINQNNPIINGWDIGGVNIKSVQIDTSTVPPTLIKSTNTPFEIWHNPDELAGRLIKAEGDMGIKKDQSHAVTITAELSDVFRTKREGILIVVDAVKKAFGDSQVFIFNLEGNFYNPAETEISPLLCAASNWLASASYIGSFHKDCILIDVGSTTTDIIPILNGKAVCEERTDTGRLINGKLVYSGALRTNPNVIASTIPLYGKNCPVAAEYFTVMADVHLVLGDITPDQYTCPTPDGRKKTVEEARARLARLICSDIETLPHKEIDNIALYLKEKQKELISMAISDVLSRNDRLSGLPAVVTGTGSFLAERAAKNAGIKKIIHWESEGDMNCLPAFAVASLLKTHLKDL